jgi:lysine/ornithine N-monooxygenase
VPRVQASRRGLDTAVAVIGAGPYGLSLSAHLSAHGVSHEIFGETMELWSGHMPVGMFLKSEGFASNISDPRGEHTLERFCAEHERRYRYERIAAPIPVDTFERYGRWFQERLVPNAREQRVAQVRRASTGFELALDTDETLRAKSVVVATGMTGHAYLPQVLQGLPPTAVVHTYDYRDPAQARGSEVAVIGAGQSALEAAALMHEQGAKVRVIARAAEVAWNSKPGGPARSVRQRWRYPESGLGEGRSQWLYSNHPVLFHLAPEAKRRKHAYMALGPAGAWWLRDRIEGRVEVLLGCTVLAARAQNGGVHLKLRGRAGTEQLQVSQVVAGTGFRPDVSRLRFLEPALLQGIATDANGTVILDRCFQSSVPGLHFVGYLAALSFGPVMRFVYGTEFTARTVSGLLAR